MVFWLAILAGGVFVWLAVRMGFYQSWALLFNVVISIYLAIFLAPVVAGWAPADGGASAYGIMLSLIAVAVGCFAVLYGLSYVFLTGQFNVSFPKVLDILAAGVLGFVAGFLILSFAALVVTASPLARRKVVATLGFTRQGQQANIECLAWCCDLVHSVVRFEPAENATQEAVERLLEGTGRASAAGETEGNNAGRVSAPVAAPRPPLEDL